MQAANRHDIEVERKARLKRELIKRITKMTSITVCLAASKRTVLSNKLALAELPTIIRRVTGKWGFW